MITAGANIVSNSIYWFTEQDVNCGDYVFFKKAPAVRIRGEKRDLASFAGACGLYYYFIYGDYNTIGCKDASKNIK
jgi:hypothetical protein